MNRQSILLALLGAVLVVALWWFFLYSPGREDLAAVQDEIAAAEAEQVSLQQRVAALEGVRARAAETEAAIAQVQSFVPTDPELPGVLRQVEAAAEDAGVEITALAATRPEPVEEGSTLHLIGLTMNVEGSYFQTVDFLRRVEDPAIVARGVEWTTATIALEEYPTLTVALTGEAYASLEPGPEPPSDEAPVTTDETGDEDDDDDGTEGADQPTEEATP